MPPQMKSDWEKAVDVLVKKHFTQGPTLAERARMAERYMNDILHHMTNHLGKNERTARREIEAGFSDPSKVDSTIRKYRGIGL